MDSADMFNTSSTSSNEDFLSRTRTLQKNNLDYTSVFIRQEIADVLMNSSSVNCSHFLENSPVNITYSDHLFTILCRQSASYDGSRSGAHHLNDQAIFLLAIYSVILLLSVTGNLLVLVTLLQHRRMRTPTNILLLNLSASDLLLIVVCMPFTLTGSLLRDFIFGRLACHVIPYLQAVSVSVSAWTLVTISHERYSGICRPLKSRGWRTAGHARRKITCVWVLSLTSMLPIALISQLQPIGDTGRHKCREHWPSTFLEKLYSIALMIFLLLVPLLLMLLAYVAIRKVLNQSISNDRQNSMRFPRNAPISSTLSRRNTCQTPKRRDSSFKSRRNSSAVQEPLPKIDQSQPFTENYSPVVHFLHDYKWTSTGDEKLRTLRTMREAGRHSPTKSLHSGTPFRKAARNISNDNDSTFFHKPPEATLRRCDHQRVCKCEQNFTDNLEVDTDERPDDDSRASIFGGSSPLSSACPATLKNYEQDNVHASKISIHNEGEKEGELFVSREKEEEGEIHVDEDTTTAPRDYNFYVASCRRNSWGDSCQQEFELKCNSVLTIDEQNQKRPCVNLHRDLVTYTETKKYEGSKNRKFSRMLSLVSSKKLPGRSHGLKKENNALRSTTSLKSLREKQRMIKMIGVVVLEFFVCWTPLYVVNTVALYAPYLVYGFLGMKGVSAVHLLAYCSACCNPITYCFMSKSFRSAFLNVIRCNKSSISRS